VAEFQKYMFDTQFDAPPPPPEPVVEEVPAEPPPPPPPTFSEAELEAARQEAYARGQHDGLQQGRSEALQGEERMFNQLLDGISLRLAELMGEQAARYHEERELILQIGMTIARKLLPAFEQRQGLTEIEAAIAHVIGELGNEPRLVVRVQDAQLDKITARLQPLAEQRGYAGQLVLMGDAAMGPSDFRLEWADGGLERDTARLWGNIDRAVAQALHGGQLPADNVSAAGAATSTTSIES